jgi:hypothetical protein
MRTVKHARHVLSEIDLFGKTEGWKSEDDIGVYRALSVDSVVSPSRELRRVTPI